jgi:hypothetical protein
MTLRDYCALSMVTKTRPQPNPPMLWGLGLAGETFELLESLDGMGDPRLECGDVLWYIAAICDDTGLTEEFLEHFERHPNIGNFGPRRALGQAVGSAVEHIKKIARVQVGCAGYAREGEAPKCNASILVPALSKAARSVYYIVRELGLEWGDVLQANLDKLAGRKAAGSLDDVVRA